MSTPQGCNDDSEVIETFTEALKQRVGQERFGIWFANARFGCGEPETADEPAQADARQQIVVTVPAQFLADRLTKHFLPALRGAAAVACGGGTAIRIAVDAVPARQPELPFDHEPPAAEPVAPEGPGEADAGTQAACGQTAKRQRGGSVGTGPRRRRSATPSLSAILNDGRSSRGGGKSSSPVPTPSAAACQTAAPEVAAPEVAAPDVATPGSSQTGQRPARGTAHAARRDDAPPPTTSRAAGPSVPGTRPKTIAAGGQDHRWESVVPGSCNELALAACRMVIENPRCASPLVLWGPPGTGKTHLLHAVADQLRRAHRLRRVVYLSAEEFTNDFIKALHGSSLPAFRLRFRDADALMIDDIQFFVEKKATIRELHHTIELLAEAGKPLLFAGTKTPAEIRGLGHELSGRLAAGLVCQVERLDAPTRGKLLQRYASERCPIEWPEAIVGEIAAAAEGDGRVLSGIVNLVALLQRMQGAMPSMEEIRRHGGHLLRSSAAPITLSSIQRAVENVFELETKSLQSDSQIKKVTEPRMLAMYLSRELTSSAYSEIGGHYGGRSHSTAILANQRVRKWIDDGHAIGRGKAALPAAEAIRRIEAALRAG